MVVGLYVHVGWLFGKTAILQQFYEFVYVVAVGGPRCGEAYGDAVAAGRFPLTVGKMASQTFCLLQGYGSELLVGGGIKVQGIAFLEQSLAYAHGLHNGMTANGIVESAVDVIGIDRRIVGTAHEGVELEGYSPAFGQKSTVPLDVREKAVGFSGVGENHGLAVYGTALGAANIESIAQTGDVAQSDIGIVGGKPVTHAGSVKV